MMNCGIISSAPDTMGSESSSPRSMACIALRLSSASKRLPGTNNALLGVSKVWFERPIRCNKRLTPLGAPTWMTSSTSPQSIPSSSADVVTIARNNPLAIMFSVLWRCSLLSAPWYNAIGRFWSLTSHNPWKINSAWARVFTNTNAVWAFTTWV